MPWAAGSRRPGCQLAGRRGFATGSRTSGELPSRSPPWVDLVSGRARALGAVAWCAETRQNDEDFPREERRSGGGRCRRRSRSGKSLGRGGPRLVGTSTPDSWPWVVSRDRGARWPGSRQPGAVRIAIADRGAKGQVGYRGGGLGRGASRAAPRVREPAEPRSACWMRPCELGTYRIDCVGAVARGAVGIGSEFSAGPRRRRSSAGWRGRMDEHLFRRSPGGGGRSPHRFGAPARWRPRGRKREPPGPGRSTNALD